MQKEDPSSNDLTDWLAKVGTGEIGPVVQPAVDPDATVIGQLSPGAFGTAPSGSAKAATAMGLGARAPAAPLDGNLPNGYRLEQFEVVDRLGQGGFSIVYKVFDHRLQAYRALKEYMPREFAMRSDGYGVIPRSERNREIFDVGLRSFVAEGVTLAKFDHPSLVRVYQNIDYNGTAYMVMQLVEGATLEQTVDGMASQPHEAWLLKLLDAMTSALEIVHAEGIVHRDIKPANVMLLAGSGRPLLLDFGAARQVIDRGDPVTGMLTPGYAPIEQYPDSGMQQGPWTDIYALAATIHRLLVGTAPGNVLARQVKDSYVPLATKLQGRYSPRFLNALDHALEVDPEKRPRTMEQFRAELGVGEHVVAANKPPALAVGKRAGLPAMAWAGIAGVALLAIGGVAFLVFGSSGKQVAQKPADPSEVVTQAPPPAPSPRDEVVATPLPAPPPPPPPVATVPLDPAAAFEQILGAASADYKVGLSLQRATLKVNVTPLQVQLTSSRPGWYYVLVHDTDQEVRILFPRSGKTDNQLAAGKGVTLPPKSQGEQMAFGEPLGKARLLAIVSDAPLDFSAATKKEEDGIRVLFRGAEAPAAGARPLYLGVPKCDTPACGAYGAAAADFSVVR
ncbi:MAG: DUF4384 domain-containing protein [Burkholderiales bacterium]|nr:DUF4384 domain-containing protein [Burkholderiales bacterium]